MCLFSSLCREALIIGEDQASPGTKQYCISKITNAKRDSGVAHFIE
jgi:hypothetical protein